ncbi:MAG: FAD-dependent oxidoreductase [Deltaproteobacteria bacterium]|nr:FAD-dependent oxidoreductase [Deltaproteobacteria bacterium]MCB9787179.1 FAD-dependent oxidoreductase [Deltaproteobacteria bacterium]
MAELPPPFAGDVAAPTRLRPKVAIIGAGPAGLEVARVLTGLGLEVLVYEAGTQVGGGFARFSHVRLFTPWRMNVAEGALQDLAEGGVPCPVDWDERPTVGAFVERYLGALGRHPRIAPTLRLEHRLLAAGRDRALRIDHPRMPQRADSQFRLLLQDGRGRERIARADVLVDCTGITQRAAWVGRGGIPAPGETALRAAGRIEGWLPDLAGEARERFRGKRILLVGAGYSAATAAVELAELVRETPTTRVEWVVRHEATDPIEAIPDDPLPERAALTRLANAAVAPGGPIRLHRENWVERMTSARDGVLDVTLSGGARMVFDELLAMVGFAPDFTPLDGLQVHLDYATRGPRKLAQLLRQEDQAGPRRPVAAARAPTPPGPEVLMHPEPDLFVLGHKSFGNRSDYFFQSGYLQARLLAEVMRWRTL